MSNRLTRFFLGAIAACVAGAYADTVVQERWDYPDGPIDKLGKAGVDGWAGTWKSADFKIVEADGGATGAGAAERRMAKTVDFSADDEWYLLVTFKRTGWSKAKSDYLSLQLSNRDREESIATVPLHVGVSSRDVFEIGIGAKQQIFFGNAATDDPRTLVAKLTTRAKEPDLLKVWVFTDKVPDALPEKPDGEAKLDYAGKSNLLKIMSAKTDGYTATVGAIRLGNAWADVAKPAPVAQVLPHEFRPLTPLRVTPDGRHPLSTHWSSISVLHWQGTGRPQIVESASQGWAPRKQTIYVPQPGNGVALPEYRASAFTGLPHGQYQEIATGKPGVYDLIDRDTLTCFPARPRVGQTPAFAEPYTIATTGDVTGNRFIADLDGDAVPDLVTGRLLDPAAKWAYWPETGGPWQLPRLTHVGPHRDLDVTDGFRGYDIAGNWLGEPPTYAAYWAKGSRAAGRLAFAAPTPVYYGNDDFPVQWKNHSLRLDPCVIERDKQRYLVLFGAVDQVLALPIRGLVDGRLTVGRAEPLLAAGQDMRLSSLSDVHAVVDLDGDGQDEIVLGSGNNGRVSVIGGTRVGAFEVRGQLWQRGGEVSVDTLAVPTRADWDGDGVPDLVVGDSNGLISIWPGTADPLVYGGATYLTDTAGKTLFLRGPRNLQGPQEVSWGYSQVFAGDWDGDGTIDLIVNDNTATMRLLRRDSPGDPTRVRATVLKSPAGTKLPAAWRSRAAIVPGTSGVAGDRRAALLYLDIDQRAVIGVPDIAGGDTIGRVLPLKYADGHDVVLAGFGGASGRTAFEIVDWDGDQVWDIVFGASPINLPVFATPEERRLNDYVNTSAAFVMKNVGTAARPVFERPRRVVWADNSYIRVETHAFNVCALRWRPDAPAGLIVGDGPGNLFYLARDTIRLLSDRP